VFCSAGCINEEVGIHISTVCTLANMFVRLQTWSCWFVCVCSSEDAGTVQQRRVWVCCCQLSVLPHLPTADLRQNLKASINLCSG
jgi:hypothetical protein